MSEGRQTVRVAAMADLHYSRTSAGALREAFAAANDAADALVLCGDLTDYGLPEEARLLAADLAAVRVPVMAVLGNHDFESGRVPEVCEVLSGAGVKMIDGEACEVNGVGFAGVKGFGGGFGRGTLGFWGEPATKAFVQEALNEALRLESALARVRGLPTVAVLHYAPVAATVSGEPVEIWPYLGTSRLEEPLTRHPVVAVVHGHAHNGAPEGRLAGGAPVYNVSVSLMRRHFPDRAPFRLLEVPVPVQGADPSRA
jgi:Icc-related predicted phosphoesterase